jgi:hypothetical protein
MKSAKLVALPLAAALIMAGAQAMPARAGGTTPPAYATMDEGTGLFPTGGSVPNEFGGKVDVTPGKSIQLKAAKFLASNVSNASGPSIYEFAFWDVGATPAHPSPLSGTLIPTRTATFTAPAAGTEFDATAWYVAVGGGCGDPLPDGGCGTEAAVSAFDLSTETPLSTNPIGSVLPASDWTSPSSSVSTIDVSPTITAQTCLGGTYSTEKFDFGCTTSLGFKRWFEIGSTTLTTPELSLTVPEGTSPSLIAMYDYLPESSSGTHFCIPGPPPNCT